MFLLLSGCAAEETLRAETDAQRLLDAVVTAEPVDITVIPTPMPAAPEIAYTEWRHTDALATADGLLTVDVDAAVRMPAAGTLPVMEVSAWFFSEEWTKQMFNYFFAGEQPTVDTNEPIVKSKDDLRALIAQYESYIAQGIAEEQTLLTDEELRDEIRRIEEQIPDAPDAAIIPETVYADGTMQPGEYWNNDEVQLTHELRVEDADEYLLIRTPDKPNECSVSYLSYSNRTADRPIFSNSFVPWTVLEAGAGDARVPYPYADAVALAEDVLKTAGVSDVRLHTAYLAEAQGQFAYVFRYVRTVGGHPAALNFQNVRHSDNRWDYELIEFVVGEGGLHSVTWESPTTLGSLVDASPDVLSFEEAYAIFSPMILAQYEEKTHWAGRESRIEIDISRIELAHVRIRDMGVDGKEGYYVPAWVFYGTEKDDGRYNMDGYVVEAAVLDAMVPKIRTENIMAINALDGSVIDFDKGY